MSEEPNNQPEQPQQQPQQQQQQQQQQKLFRLPGTIEEEDCEREQQLISRAESPLLAQRNNVQIMPSIPKNMTLLRVSTQSSSITGIGRQDSTRFRAGPTRKLRRRAVLKSGECNVLQSRISRRSLRFLQDIFTTLVDTQWRWTLLCFALSFLLSWLIFAGIWWLIAFTHGDFDPKHMASNNWRPCVSELHSFTSCFLFSIETQHTIGYGGRSTTEECPEAIFIMCIQSISGVMIQAFMVGIVFAKMSRPKQRTQTLLFSKQAVICQRDGELCLMFRVGDMRKSHIIGAIVRAQLIRSRTTKEGEILPHNQQELTVGADGQAENLFFIWPCTVVHRINAESPFYNVSAEDMLTERFEIVVILEGTIESTGQTTQARSSYLPSEILWGHRFEPLVSYSKERQGYEVDYSLFNSTVQVDTPLCSGRELAEFYRLQDELRHQTSPGYIIDEVSTPQSELVPQRYQPVKQSYFQSTHHHHHHHHHHRHNQQRHKSELSLVDVKYAARSTNQCYTDSSAPPPPYGRDAKDSQGTIDAVAVGKGEDKGTLMENERTSDNTSIVKYPSCTGNESRDSRKTCDRRRAIVRSHQELQPRFLEASKKYLMLEHSTSNGNLWYNNSRPSERGTITGRRHADSEERLNSLRRVALNERRGKELREIVVHRLVDDEDEDYDEDYDDDDVDGSIVQSANSPKKRKRRSYEQAQLQNVNEPSGYGNSIDGSSPGCNNIGSSSSCSSETETRQLVFTSV